jgi:hypothetical protein
MKQVKAAVGENDAAAVAFVASKPQNRFVQSENCRIQRVSMQARKIGDTAESENLVYHAAALCRRSGLCVR